MRSKGIGPQGLGLKGNNGYRIGSPAKQTTAGEFAYEQSLRDKEMGKSTKVVDKFKAAATALTSDKTYAGEKAKYRKERKEAYNKKVKK
tara:strand:- start:164 stop:430 length:267 start_codon:yes stop_codon:yes gene_type:complete